MSTHRISPAAADVRAAVYRATSCLSVEEIRAAASPTLLDMLPSGGTMTMYSVSNEAMASGHRVALYASIAAVSDAGEDLQPRVHVSWTNHFREGRIILELDRIVEA